MRSIPPAIGERVAGLAMDCGRTREDFVTYRMNVEQRHAREELSLLLFRSIALDLMSWIKKGS